MTSRLPNLTKSLHNYDLGHLRIAAELWGLELNAPNARAAVQKMVTDMLDRELITEVMEALPVEATRAINDLAQNDGSLPWPRFTRQFGEVREMGPGRRDREKPYLNPISPAEILWYRGLVARAFFDSPTGPKEFAYIPSDFLPLLPAPQDKATLSFGRLASQRERQNVIHVQDRILDHTCTFLAALRLGYSSKEITSLANQWDTPSNSYPISPNALQGLLASAGLLDEVGLPLPEPTRAFLESSRGETLAQLTNAWVNSSIFNELHLIPELHLEGEWENDPFQARQAILEILTTVPANSWWNLSAFIADVHKHFPDFQRPTGDYDSWFIRDKRTGEYLRGFKHWEDIEGALIRYIITGPMHWLGILDLAALSADSPAEAFRQSNWSGALLSGNAPEGMPPEDATLLVTSDAHLHIPRLAPRAARYQVARFSLWESEDDGAYHYRLTPTSLQRARKQGLRVSHLLALLRRDTPAIPPSLIKALERWEEHGTEAYLERVLVLRLSSPEILTKLRTSRAARFLGDPLGPAAVIVKPGAWEKVLATLTEMGYLGEIKEIKDR